MISFHRAASKIIYTVRYGLLGRCDEQLSPDLGAADRDRAIAFHKVAEEVARQISIEAMKPELVIKSRAR